MIIIAGLGNPGDKYALTRHNAGFMAADCLARGLSLNITGRRFSGVTARGKINGKNILLLKPQTYMNLSGVSIAAAARYYKTIPSDIIVIHDDTAFPLGMVKIKQGGGGGGHNGLTNIIERVGDNDFIRLRIGIGQKAPLMTLYDYVLSRFQKEDMPILEEAISAAAAAALLCVREGVQAAMNKVNSVK